MSLTASERTGLCHVPDLLELREFGYGLRLCTDPVTPGMVSFQSNIRSSR